jgi:ribonuclease E
MTDDYTPLPTMEVTGDMPVDTITAADPTASDTGTDGQEADDSGVDDSDVLGEPTVRSAAKKRRRGSRGGKNRKKPANAADGDAADGDGDDDDDDSSVDAADVAGSLTSSSDDDPDHPDHPDHLELLELPERISEGRPSVAAAERALVRKPQIGDTRPAPPSAQPASAQPAAQRGERTRNDKPKAAKPKVAQRVPQAAADDDDLAAAADAAKKKRRRGTASKGPRAANAAGDSMVDADLDADAIERRRGRERNGRPIGRYLMAVQVRPTLTQVAVLEGRTLIEHYVSRPADDVSQIHGNIYLGKVQNVLPGMEAAFVDIGTPKNAVLYRGDVQYDPEDIVEKSGQMRIEQMLRPKQLVLCQVTKNPISAKGARLTQEVSLPGRFVVLIPNSKTYGISKRLPDDVRKRLRAILDRVKPAQHGLIVRTAAENATEHELRADMTRLLDQWNVIEAKAKKANSPTLLYREPELAVRVIREEFNVDYRGVIIDDQRLFDDVKDYIGAFNPELADRVEFYDAVAEGLPLYERQHVHEQLHKALDRKVWLPSGGSLIIEHTEALTVIDVNTGKNVGTSNLEETVYRNNLEAAEEVAKQLRLRDIGGIVVIDFIDMEIKDNRRKVVDAFRSALARDKTRTQVFDITELGLVEMTRKRIGEGLLVNFADQCPNCEGRGVMIDHALLT